MSRLVEQGFKQVRGQLTEGRYLTFEMLGFALTNLNGTFVGISRATKKHESPKQRWIIHTVGGPGAGSQFYIQSSVDKKYIAALPLVGRLTANIAKAQAFTITYKPHGAGYFLSIAEKPETFVNLLPNGRHRSTEVSVSASIDWEGGLGGFAVYSVSYHS
jgi:phospholipase C